MPRKRRGEGGLEDYLKDVRKFMWQNEEEEAMKRLMMRVPVVAARAFLMLAYQGAPLLRLFRNIFSDEVRELKRQEAYPFKIGESLIFSPDVDNLEPMPVTVWATGIDTSAKMPIAGFDLGQVELLDDHVKDLALESYLHDLSHYGFCMFGHGHLYPRFEAHHRHLELVKDPE